MYMPTLSSRPQRSVQWVFGSKYVEIQGEDAILDLVKINNERKIKSFSSRLENLIKKCNDKYTWYV